MTFLKIMKENNTVMRKALFIANGIWIDGKNPGISGGDVRWIEIAKEWQKIGFEIHVLTTRAGIELCKKLGLNAVFHRMKAQDSYFTFSYVNRALKSFSIPRELKRFSGIIYVTTEHFYDVIPGAIIKRNNPNDLFVVVAHWVAPLIRKGTLITNSLLFYVNQRIGFRVAKKYADVILAVSEYTRCSIIKMLKIPGYKVVSVKCGIPYDEIRSVASKVKSKDIDGIFMKRFDGTKGVFDVVKIWRKVVKEIPNAKLVLVGHGPRSTLIKLKKLIGSLGLSKNVYIKGPIYDPRKKFLLLATSKLFLLPSYEENWAIVIGEALAAGVPVICYRLPSIVPIWQDKVVWVPKGDINTFAQLTIKLLKDGKYKVSLIDKGVKYVKKYSWSNIAKEELEILLNVTKER